MRRKTMLKRMLVLSLGILAAINALILVGCGSSDTTTGIRADGAKGNPNLVTVYKPFG